MPDVLTHLLIGVSLAILIRPRGTRSEQMLIVLGALLPDIERPTTWLLEAIGLDWVGLGFAFHSILGTFVLSCVMANCFVLNDINFRCKFVFVFAGCMSHLFLDMMMYPWVEYGLYLLYPIRMAFSFHLLWPDFWWYPVIGLGCFLIALLIGFLIFSRK